MKMVQEYKIEFGRLRPQSPAEQNMPQIWAQMTNDIAQVAFIKKKKTNTKESWTFKQYI